MLEHTCRLFIFLSQAVVQKVTEPVTETEIFRLKAYKLYLDIDKNIMLVEI